MEKKDENIEKDSKGASKKEDKNQEKAFEKWKETEKNNMGNDVTSEIKIANAGGELEGGENKQWHMDQGNFDEDEKRFFENSDDKEQEQK